MKRKILSLILVFAMTVSLLTVGTGAVEPTYGDTAGHWAESSIERWSGHGIIQGSNGLFDPNGQLTCAQLATILAKLLKLPAAKDAGFTDNTADAWYYDAINRCAAAGILNGNGDGTVTPEAPITRERAMVMLARALGIEPIRKPDLTKYTDAAQVSAYAQGYVAALIEAGIVGGVTANKLAPQDNINRASTVTILDRAISTYADEAGATVKADGKGIVLVVAENVKITGAPEGTKIVVADGATGLTVNGKAVSDDQTYIVPKTEPAKPSGSSSGGSVHTHAYTTFVTNWNDMTTVRKCSCGATQTIENSNTYYIANDTDLKAFRDKVNVGDAFVGKTIQLTDNINLKNEEWTPIGTSEHPFSGIFDGDNKTISNLSITKTGATSETDYNAGLFGCVKGVRTNYVATSNIWNSDTYTLNADSVIAQYTAAIKNLKLESVAVNTDGTIVGALVGKATSAYIYNVDVLSGVVSGTKNFGGVVGRADGCILNELTTGSSLEVKSCEYRSDIGSYYSLGGIVGTLRADKESESAFALSAVLNCTNNAAVSAYLTSAAAGGVIGATSSSGASVIYNCVNNGKVTIIGLSGNADEQRNNSACGIGGQIDGSIGGYGTSVIANCVNNGEIKNASNKKAGTLAGIANYFSGTYYNCTNKGNISGTACVVSGIAGTGSEVVINQCSNLAATLTGGDYISTISAVTSKTTYKNMTFATSEELQKALTTGTTSDTITLENVTVTTPEALTLPAACRKFTSDRAICTTLTLSGEITRVEINMPGSYVLSGTAGKEVTISGNSTVTNGDPNGGKIILTGENATIINPSDKTMNAARFDGTGTYTLDNYGTIASNNNHVVSTQSACTITVNNHRTIKTLASGCYAMLFYDGCTAIVNQYPNSSICEADGVSGYLLAWAGNRSEENQTGDTKASSVIYNTYDNAGQLTESWQMAANPKYMLVGSVSSQEVLTSAINNVPVRKETSIKLADGTYTLPSLESKSITISGTKGTVIDMKGSVNKATSASFDGVTVEFANENYKGFQHTGKLTYKNCTIKGLQFLYADEVEFINCIFEQENNDSYHIWTYGAKDVTFTGCTFNSTEKSKSILCYIEGTGNTFTRTFNSCTFTATGTAEKSAIMINPTANAGTNIYTVNINDCTATGYAENGISGQTIVGVKETVKDTIIINIDGEQIYSRSTGVVS